MVETMNRVAERFALWSRGATVADIARSQGVSKQAVSQSLGFDPAIPRSAQAAHRAPQALTWLVEGCASQALRGVQRHPAAQQAFVVRQARVSTHAEPSQRA